MIHEPGVEAATRSLALSLSLTHPLKVAARRMIEAYLVTLERDTVTPELEGLPEAVKEVAKRIAQEHRVTVKGMRGESRVKRVVLARHEAIAELHEMRTDRGEYRYSLPQIGAFFNRDHTTVIHVRDKWELPKRLTKAA